MKILIYQNVWLFLTFFRFYKEFVLHFDDGSHPDVKVVLNRCDAERVKSGGLEIYTCCIPYIYITNKKIILCPKISTIKIFVNYSICVYNSGFVRHSFKSMENSQSSSLKCLLQLIRFQYTAIYNNVMYMGIFYCNRPG